MFSLFYASCSYSYRGNHHWYGVTVMPVEGVEEAGDVCVFVGFWAGDLFFDG